MSLNLKEFTLKLVSLSRKMEIIIILLKNFANFSVLIKHSIFSVEMPGSPMRVNPLTPRTD